MNTKLKTLVLSVSALSAAVVHATTGTYTISSSTGLAGVDFWTEIESGKSGTSGNNGSFNSAVTNNPYANWCDSLTLSKGSGVEYGVFNLNEGLLLRWPDGTTSGYRNLANLTLSNGVILNVNSGGNVNNTGNLTINNATLRINSGGTLSSQINMDAGNSALLEISAGGSYDGYSGNTRIGRKISVGQNNGNAIFRINGSAITKLEGRNLRLFGNSDMSLTNRMGGSIEWVADANGITTFVFQSSIQEELTGIISVDFSNLVWQDSWGDEKQFTLMTFSSGSSSFIDAWLSNVDRLGEIIGATGEFSRNSNGTEFYVTIDRIIPEPSTYAMIFGALALAFAAYRRRK